MTGSPDEVPLDHGTKQPKHVAAMDRLKRWWLVLLLVASTIVVLIILIISNWPTHQNKSPPITNYNDEVTDQPMFNRRVIQDEDYEIQIWTDCEVLFDRGDPRLVCDVISNDGIQPLTGMSLSATDSLNRQWNAEIDLLSREPKPFQLRDGRVLLRYAIEDPLGGDFSRVLMPQGNKIQLDVLVRWSPPSEKCVNYTLQLRSRRR